MTFLSRATAVAFASVFLMGTALAETPAAAPAAPAAPAAKTEKPRTAASIECSKEADAKGLKGKERKKFRSECKKEAKAKQ
jgi:hypothetical protein